MITSFLASFYSHIPRSCDRKQLYPSEASAARDYFLTKHSRKWCFAVMSIKEVVFVVNPAGRNGQNRILWKHLSVGLQSQLGLKYQVTETLTEYPCHAQLIARQAAGRGAYAVVAVGGDGTLHEVVNGLMWLHEGADSGRRDAPIRPLLGVWPLGTGSDFAANWGWTDDRQEAVNRVKYGEPQPISVGHVTCCSSKDGHPVGRYFINVSSCGLSGRAVMYVAAMKWMGRAVYDVAVGCSFLRHRNTPFDVILDGQQPLELSHVTLMAVGNGAYFGAGTKISPASHPTTTTLQVVAMCNKTLLDKMMYRRVIKRGEHIMLSDVFTWEVHESVQIQHKMAGAAPFLVEADGELLGHTPATWKVVPHALQLLT